MSSRHSGWNALAEAVAPGARVTRLRRLAGAGMTDAYDVTLDRTPRRVVVKLYRDGDGTAPLEWSRLGFAQRVALPVPEPIVADLESVWFGRPTVVMSSGTAAASVVSSTGAQNGSTPGGTTSRIAEPRCAYSSDRTSPIASPTHTRASSAAPLTNSPCTTSCVCSAHGITLRSPSPRTESKAMCPTINCHSHTSMSNCDGHCT